MSRPLGPRTVRFVPLGGLGEIGMNCLAVEQEDGILVIDCGNSFPQDDLGIDVIHPDFTWLRERANRVKGVFLTHGHEDHIGAVPYLLEELDVPVWGPRHALALVRRRLTEHDFRPHEYRLREAVPRQHYEVGPFEVEPIRVAHSIVEATALRILTRAGVVLHTGDFNFDPDPPDGEPTDEERLCEVAREGVDLMLSDSTNIDVNGPGGTERDVGVTLERLISVAPARAIVAMFASNIQRLRMLGDIAQRVERKVCVLGRSLNTQIEVAHEIGRLHWPSNLIIPPERARSWPRDNLLVLAGGSQAERNSALARLGADTHNHLAIEAGDTVILSARIIPGNERVVYTLMSTLLRKGAVLHTRVTEPGVHTSGHAVREEQQRMLELLRPRAFVPVHGSLHHLFRHAELARSLGVEPVVTVENGTPFCIEDGQLSPEAPVRHGRVPIACGGEPIDPETLCRRAELGRTGVVAIALTVDAQGRILTDPTVSAYGVPSVDGDGAALRQVTREVVHACSRSRRRSDESMLTHEIRRAARRRLFDLCGCRPVVQVHVAVSASTDDP